jgi:hypothetical protein
MICGSVRAYSSNVSKGVVLIMPIMIPTKEKPSNGQILLGWILMTIFCVVMIALFPPDIPLMAIIWFFMSVRGLSQLK